MIVISAQSGQTEGLDLPDISLPVVVKEHIADSDYFPREMMESIWKSDWAVTMRRVSRVRGQVTLGQYHSVRHTIHTLHIIIITPLTHLADKNSPEYVIT